MGCKSITFFSNSKRCSHFSTECLVTKEVAYKDVSSMRLTKAAPHPRQPSKTQTGRQWIHLGHAACDPGSGEVYRSESSGKASDLAACQKSCQDDPWCKSITFFNLTKHCSHFTTECLVTKEVAHKDVISMRLKGDSIF